MKAGHSFHFLHMSQCSSYHFKILLNTAYAPRWTLFMLSSMLRCCYWRFENIFSRQIIILNIQDDDEHTALFLFLCQIYTIIYIKHYVRIVWKWKTRALLLAMNDVSEFGYPYGVKGPPNQKKGGLKGLEILRQSNWIQLSWSWVV